MDNNMQSSEIRCPFCNPPEDAEIICECSDAYAIWDQYPVSQGHILIIPKRHVPSYFDLTDQEQVAITKLLKKAKDIIQLQFHPDGYNIGINIGEVAGQTVFHCHVHLIPRYSGDVKNPRGGIRGIIPGKQNY